MNTDTHRHTHTHSLTHSHTHTMHTDITSLLLTNDRAARVEQAAHSPSLSLVKLVLLSLLSVVS
jgi:hypothetical protein